MATKTKIEKERQRLIEKYGDKVLIEIVDYYYPEITFTKTGTTQRNVCATIKVSQVQIDNTADLKEVERRLMEKGAPIVRKWKFPQSEKLYNSPEEKARREAYQKEHPWPKKRLDEIFLPMLIKDTIDEPVGEGQPDNRPVESPEEESTES